MVLLRGRGDVTNARVRNGQLVDGISQLAREVEEMRARRGVREIRVCREVGGVRANTLLVGRHRYG